MTKRELLRILEPFDGDISIVTADLKDIKAIPSVLPNGEEVVVVSECEEDGAA